MKVSYALTITFLLFGTNLVFGQRKIDTIIADMIKGVPLTKIVYDWECKKCVIKNSIRTETFPKSDSTRQEYGKFLVEFYDKKSKKTLKVNFYSAIFPPKPNYPIYIFHRMSKNKRFYRVLIAKIKNPEEIGTGVSYHQAHASKYKWGDGKDHNDYVVPTSSVLEFPEAIVDIDSTVYSIYVQLPR